MSSIEEFQEDLRKTGRAENTIKLYTFHILRADEIGWRKYLKNPEYSPSYKRSIKASLAAWAKFNEDDELLKELRRLKLPPIARVKEKPPMSRDELEELRDILGEFQHHGIADAEACVIGLMAYRGFRVGDALRLKRKEIEKALDSNVLIFTAKGGKVFTWKNKRFKKWLIGLIEQGKKFNHVWELIGSSYETARHKIWRTLGRIGKEMGLEEHLYPHRIRRTLATLFLQAAGGDLTKLKAYFGWSNIATAASYSDFYTQEELEEIADEI